jgi:hypothetical protein
VVAGAKSTAGATDSIAIGTNVLISMFANNAVAVSAYTKKSCATTEPGSLTLCADKNVTIEGSALVVNGVDVLMATSNLEAKLLNTTSNLTAELVNTKAELLNTRGELADLNAKVAALAALKTQSQTNPASGSLVGTLLALGLTAAAVA